MTNQGTTLVALTTRAVTFVEDNDRPVVFPRTAPANTEVYVTVRRNGMLRLRIPGTLWIQEVHESAVRVP